MTRVLETIRGYLQGDGLAILPELELLLFAIGLFVFSGWREGWGKYWSTLLALAGVGFSGYTVWIVQGRLATRNVFTGFYETVLADSSFVFFAAVLLAGAALAILLTLDEPHEPPRLHALLLTAAAGMLLMVSGIHVASLFAGFELVTGSLFLVAASTRTAQGAAPRSRRPLIFSVVASALLAAGFLALYRIAASGNLGQIAFTLSSPRLDIPSYQPPRRLVAVAFFLVLSGAIGKIAVLPFQAWTRSTGGMWRALSAFVSGPVYVAAFALLLRLCVVVFEISAGYRRTVFLAFAVALAVTGGVSMLRRQTWPQFLGCAALVEVALLILAGGAQNDRGLTACAFLSFVYIFAIAAGFAAGRAEEGQGGDPASLQVAKSSLGTTAARLMVIATFAGVPPTAGFIVRRELWAALGQARLAYLAWVAALAGIPVLYGGIRTLLATARGSSTLSAAATFVLTVGAFVCVAAGLYPELFLRFARYAFGF